MPRLATTNEQKMLKGTFKPYLARETAHSGEPLKELPDPVLPMNDAAASYYNSIGQSCINMGILEPADLDELELCAYEFGTYWEYEDERKRLKLELKKAKEDFKELEKEQIESGNPDLYLLRFKQSLISDMLKSYKIALSQRNTSFTSAVKMSAKFGLNPTDRQKLPSKPPEVEIDPFAEI
mgnify:CR=1 FL=1